jgi:CubicO group peptidase (beta-lactamase class C family)
MPLSVLLLAGLCLATTVRCGEVGAPDHGALLQPFVDHHTLAGAVTLSATQERTLSVETVGYADIAAHEPMRSDSLFWIASMSKPLTATAVMMLVDEGKVALDDAVAKYLPEFATQLLEADAEHPQGHAPQHPVTVRTLLNHTSGLPFLSPVEHGKIDLMPLREAVAGYARLALKSEPGSRYQYSNCGINTAGRIIEVVSGLAYEDFMEQRLFAPLAMRDTSCWPNAAQLLRLAKSYRPTADKAGLEEIPINYLTYPLDDRKRGPCPGGGYFSTASDLLAFCRMILAGGVAEGRRYLSAAALAEMTSKQTGALAAAYGLGWQTDAPGRFGHGGAYATDMAIDRPRGLITIFLVQHNGYANSDGGSILPTFKAAAVAALAR